MPDDPAAGLCQALGHAFARPELLETALTHASAAGDDPSRTYERLEFLGDRVLGLSLADRLMVAFPGEVEGDLARRHAHLVSRVTLAEVARLLDLGAAIRMSTGEAAAGTRDSDTVLADCLEGVLGAIYLDAGFDAASRIIGILWGDMIATGAAPPTDAKTSLQQWAQARGMGIPVYRETDREGPAHAPLFTVEVCIKGIAPATGRGGSKQAAEQQAAGRLLAAVPEGDQP